MNSYNIYMCGVGGQGIGMLSEILSRACLSAGYKIHGCDTHGLAQRGGTVVSHLRLGSKPHTPRVPPGKADIVIALERLEAQRGAVKMLKNGGTVLYYDTDYQPISVRMNNAVYPQADQVAATICGTGNDGLNGKVEVVSLKDIPDPRMQNVALLGRLSTLGLLPGVNEKTLIDALSEFVPSRALDQNIKIFKAAGKVSS